ncbi:hypothetical protein NW756_013490 [Fusarium oxysporum]|nr:hypothetical protein NW763_010560 [Fusarium oxysporum]KAJ4046541.1 hypothetical protein NW753_009362 [Fusarium oxysporum]KAJ4075269.1 hypothetical protein NW756_013490 [Fusarium oxysporum]KAJ4096026.1 hypothetical protein NW769_011631 [Fusarium oxysporum]KAJ4216834.1 hypothetical protein NW760_013450 [Fusarium oxysporum]
MSQRNRQACQPGQHYLCPASPRRRLRYRNEGGTMETGATSVRLLWEKPVNKPVIVTGGSDAYRVVSRDLAVRRAGDPITFYRYPNSSPRKKQAATTTSVCQIGPHGEWPLTQHHGSFQNSTQQLG